MKLANIAECFADPERDPIWQSMWTSRPQVKNGSIDVPSAPGFGIELDEAMVRRCRVN
jgi:D-galactarolactone cycloisomerase